MSYDEVDCEIIENGLLVCICEEDLLEKTEKGTEINGFRISCQSEDFFGWKGDNYIPDAVNHKM